MGAGDDLPGLIFDSLVPGIAIVDSKGHPRRVNAAFVRMLGFSLTELEARSVADLAHPEDRAIDSELFRELVDGERTSYRIDKRLARKDGSWVVLRVTASIHRSDPPLVVVMAQEIDDDHRSTAHALGERMKELKALHGVASMMLEATLSIDDLLDAVVALLPESMQFPEVTTACIRYAGKAHASPGHASTPWKLARAFDAAGAYGELEIVYQEEKPFLVEEEALITSIAEMTRVAIDRRAVVEALEEANVRINLALESAGMGIWEYDVVTDSVRWSAHLSRMVGLDGDASGKLGFRMEYFHPDDHGMVFQRINAAIADNGSGWVDLELRLRRTDGTWRSMMARGVVHREGGKARRVLAVLIDVSERRALEESLRRAQKLDALGQMASGVAHDFNNILTVIVFTTGYLREHITADDPILKALDDLEAATQSGVALTRQLLAFSRKSPLAPERIDLGQLVTRLEPLVARVARTCKVATELHPGETTIWADPTQLEQVLVNLIVNARDAMPEGGTIMVTTESCTGIDEGVPAKRFAGIRVRDTGTGIAPDTMTRIFEPFFTTKEAGRGTGLGLAVVANIAKQWQGRVLVESTPNEGTTFRVLFPQVE